jgi:hypothetical protein
LFYNCFYIEKVSYECKTSNQKNQQKSIITQHFETKYNIILTLIDA